MDSTKQLKELLELARRYSLRTLKFNGIEFEMSTHTPNPPATPADDVTDLTGNTAQPMPPDSEMLFFSVEEGGRTETVPAVMKKPARKSAAKAKGN